MKKQTVTVDTNILTELEDLKKFKDLFDFDITSVTNREVANTKIACNLKHSDGQILETGVWGESAWDHCVWGGGSQKKSKSNFQNTDSKQGDTEAILAIISSNSFPKRKNRENMTIPQRNQLRDAMILEAHSRENRDIFVSNDEKAYIKHGKREALQQLLNTKIFNIQEFIDYAHTGRACRKR